MAWVSFLMPSGTSVPSSAHGRRDPRWCGAAIMNFLIPAFVKVMMDHPDEPWGANYYQVVE